MVSEQRYQEKLHSTEFKKAFLIEFTKKLILNSAPFEVLKLKTILEDEGVEGQSEKENKREAIKEIIKEKEKEIKTIEQEETKPLLRKIQKPIVQRKTFPFQNFQNQRLIIPETYLPQRLQYLRPTPSPKEIDLGKLNPLIKDPFVEIIECYGENKNIIVRGNMGVKKTAITLEKNEINDIIKKISEESKIPSNIGIFKAVIGRISFMAIISEVIGSKFIIKKLRVPQQNYRMQRTNF